MAAFAIPGGPELWLLLGIVLLLFGPTQLPKLAKMFGKSAKALKEGLDQGMNEPETPEVAPKTEDAPKETGSDS